MLILWYAVILGVFCEWYCSNSIRPVIGMGEGIAGLRMLVGFGVASWGELVGGDFDVDSLIGFIYVAIWVPFGGVGR